MALYTDNWRPLDKNVYYRTIELYSMEWSGQINLSDFIITAAPFGGPIAITQDTKKLQKRVVNVKPSISIFSSSGRLISSIAWNSGKLIHFDWSCTEDLLCIIEDGAVISYDIHGNFQGKLTSMGQEAKDYKVLECKVFHSSNNCTGIAVLTGVYHFFVVNNIKEPRIRKMPNVQGLTAPPSSWTVIREERSTRIIMAKDAQLYILDQNTDKYLPITISFSNTIDAIVEMAVSVNQQHIALFSDSGPLWIGSADLETKYSEFNTDTKTRPHQLLWCGNGAIVGYWPTINILLVIGMDKSYMNDTYESFIHIVSEIDGIRVIGSKSHELLQKVPDAVTDVFRIGSLSSSALLLEAYKEFSQRNHKADEYLRMIKERNELEVAIRNCVDAAGHEFEPATQKMLLRAAKFGKSFIPEMDPVHFVELCHTLKVLNTLRISIIGLPLTYKQYEYLTLPVILDRLVLRKHYELAIAISKYFKIPDTEGKSRILTRWACHKVKSSNVDPDLTARMVADKLGYTPGISYSEISDKAMEHGHNQLSVRLLDYETRASKQVPLLIKLKQEIQAMHKAIESGDTDLIFTVILHLKNKMKKGEFHMMIRQFPAAFALYLKFCKEQDLEELREIFDQESDFNSDGDCRILESYHTSIDGQKMKILQSAVDSYKKAKNDFAAQVTDDQIKLLRCQTKLEAKLQEDYLTLSLQDTMKKLLAAREYDWADGLRKDFRVPDRRYWWLKITVLADGGDWLELEKFSKSKKSPIGYEPFVDICVQFGNTFEAKRYLPKVKDENKVKYCIKLGMLHDAAKAAFEQKDLNGLNQIESLCTALDRTLIEKIVTMKSQLGSKK